MAICPVPRFPVQIEELITFLTLKIKFIALPILSIKQPSLICFAVLPY